MVITERQKDIIYDIFNSLDLDLAFDNEKVIAVLTDFIEALFSATEPNDYEYNLNYQHYTCIINVVFDYLIRQDEKIKELLILRDEYYELLQKVKKLEQ